MRKATLKRDAAAAAGDDDQGTFGRYTSDSGYSCSTIELPWRDNEPDISCIPPGVYPMRWKWSNSHKKNVYHIEEVPGRTVIEIHPGNLAGDVSKGYAADDLGCMNPGIGVGQFHVGDKVGAHVLSKAQLGVVASVAACAALEKDLRDANGEQVDCELTIE